MTPSEIAELAGRVAETFEPKPFFPPSHWGRVKYHMSERGYWIRRYIGTVENSNIEPAFRLDGTDPDADHIITGRMLDRLMEKGNEVELNGRWWKYGGKVLWCASWAQYQQTEMCFRDWKGGERIESRVLAVALAFVAAFQKGEVEGNDT